MKHTTDVNVVAQNLRAIRQSATEQNITEGRSWYPAMGKLIDEINRECADETGAYDTPLQFAVGVFAAYSQNSTWKANVTMASKYLGGSGPFGLASVQRECEALENGADPTTYDLMGLKRADFCANLLGDMSRVTCDRWHLRAAFSTEKPPALKPANHALVTEATRIVAAEFGESPAECQAVIWCAVRGTGQ